MIKIMMANDIEFEAIKTTHATIGLITLNRVAVLNALNEAMMYALDQQLIQWADDDQVKAVVIQAAPGRAFCAGGDIRQAYQFGKAKDPRVLQFFYHEYRLNARIFHYPKPYIALLDGITMGGGAGISIHGSQCFATERLSFAMPETGIGFFPDVGATYFLSRLPYSMGIYLGLTGISINAADCMALGLVKGIMKHESLPLFMTQLLKTAFEIDNAQTLQKTISPFLITPPVSILLEQKNIIENCFHHHTINAILNALEMQQNEWGEKTAALLKTKSPTSLKVTLKALLKAKQLSFDECMQMEYQLTAHFLENHDFYEGVRAAIIDKDRMPRWQPSQLSEVSEEKIMEYFKASAHSQKLFNNVKNSD